LDPEQRVLPQDGREAPAERGGLCVIFGTVYGVDGQVLLETEEMVEKGACSAPSDTCSVNYFLKTIV